MGAGVWLAASQYLLTQREEMTLTQTATNAMRLERRLDGSTAAVADVLAQLPRTTGSVSLARYGGEWFTTSLTVGHNSLPHSLRATVLDGGAARQRFEGSDGVVRLAVGVVGTISPSDRMVRDGSCSVRRYRLSTTRFGAPKLTHNVTFIVMSRFNNNAHRGIRRFLGARPGIPRPCPAPHRASRSPMPRSPIRTRRRC